MKNYERLNELEISILKAMIARNPTDALAIKLQMQEALVIERENSGVGFFTTLKPKKTDKLIKATVIDNIFAKVDNLSNSMTFVLFIENGYMKILEGATVDESSQLINFSDVDFKITEPSS